MTVNGDIDQVAHEPIELEQRNSSAKVEARICHVNSIDGTLKDQLGEWSDYIKQLVSDDPEHDVVHSQTVTWDWEQFFEDALRSKETKFAIICRSKSRIEGCMTLMLMPEGSPNFKCPYVLVEYIESAPWNRIPHPSREPALRGVGAHLMNAAVVISDKLGYCGRLGLHSLPSACTYYESYGMERRGEEFDSDGEQYPFFALDFASESQSDGGE